MQDRETHDARGGKTRLHRQIIRPKRHQRRGHDVVENGQPEIESELAGSKEMTGRFRPDHGKTHHRGPFNIGQSLQTPQGQPRSGDAEGVQ